MKTVAWCYYALVALAAFAAFWLPPALYTFGHAWRYTPPVGLALAAVLCLARAWTPTASSPTIKPLPNRPAIDAWWKPIELLLGWLIGQPEDGPSGIYAYGPSWAGAYNPQGTRWRAFCWQCRNWFAGLGYHLWPAWLGAPPGIKRQYTVLGRTRTLQLGWTALPTTDGWSGRYPYRMVCSA